MATNAISFYKGQTAVRGQGHTTCEHHKGKTLDWFCETCQDVICANCISTVHKGHAIAMLSEVTPNNKRKIETFINETEQRQLIEMQQEIDSTQDSLEKHFSHFKSVAEEVKEKGKKLKEDIDDLIAETLSQLKVLEDENTQLLTSYKTEVENKLAKLKDQLKQCKETLQTGTDIQVFDVKNRLHTAITFPKRPVLGTAKFSQNNNTTEALTSALGEMTLTCIGQTDEDVYKDIKSPDKQLTQTSDPTPNDMARSTDPPNSLPIISLLSHSLVGYNIRCICCVGDNSAWICDGYVLTLLDSKARVRDTVESHVTVTDICVSRRAKTVWLCSEEDNSVMKLKKGKFLTPSTLARKFNTRDEPMCICAAKDGHVLVGTKHGIIQYNQEGKQILTTSQSEKPLDRSPRKISECPISENVAVLDEDQTTDAENIIVMDKHLHELYKFQPLQGAVSVSCVTDVTYDRLGQLVLADYDNDCLHLLTGNGQYQGILYNEITMPQRVCVDRQGVLWVVFDRRMSSANTIKRLQYASD